MKQKKQQRIGIMGGTFDPIHYGHLLIAQSAAEEFSLDEVWFMPTGKSPHKETSKVTPASYRCDMVEQAIADNSRFRLSEAEVNSTETNYTFQTLQRLKESFPETQFYFILGGDSLKDFHTWKKPEKICQNAVILAAVRDDMDGEAILKEAESVTEQYHAKVHILHSPNFSVSSREIRSRINDGKSIRYMLPEAIEQYIAKNGLYKNKVSR